MSPLPPRRRTNEDMCPTGSRQYYVTFFQTHGMFAFRLRHAVFASDCKILFFVFYDLVLPGFLANSDRTVKI